MLLLLILVISVSRNPFPVSKGKDLGCDTTDPNRSLGFRYSVLQEKEEHQDSEFPLADLLQLCRGVFGKAVPSLTICAGCVDHWSRWLLILGAGTWLLHRNILPSLGYFSNSGHQE